jgi:hypothetical protein
MGQMRESVTDREATARREKVLATLADRTDPIRTADLLAATGLGMPPKLFSSLLQRMFRKGLIQRPIPPGSHTQAAYLPLDGGTSAKIAVFQRGPTMSPENKRKSKRSGRLVEIATLRAKIIATLNDAPGPMLATQLYDLPQAKGFQYKLFEQLLHRMSDRNQIRHIPRLAGRFGGYSSIAHAVASGNGAILVKKRRGPYLTHPKLGHPSEDMDIEINQRDGSLAVTLKGRRVTVKVV